MELTEFEKKLKFLCSAFQYVDSSSDDVINGVIQDYAKDLLDLARKEVEKEITKEVEQKAINHTYAYQNGYENGKYDALKDLPKWKKSDRNWITNICDLATIVRCDGGDHEDYDSVVVSNRVDKDDYYIEFGELLKLPKEE